MRDSKGVDPDGRVGRVELGQVQERETVIRIYCMKKEPVFNGGREMEVEKSDFVTTKASPY